MFGKRHGMRVASTLRTQLCVRDRETGSLLADPIPAHLRDFTRRGAGLEVDSVRTGAYHLFYSPQEDPDVILHLESTVFQREEEEETFSIPLRTVWMDRNNGQDQMRFRLGVEFLLERSDSRIRTLEHLARGD